jgi:hypothetical protein
MGFLRYYFGPGISSGFADDGLLGADDHTKRRVSIPNNLSA